MSEPEKRFTDEDIDNMFKQLKELSDDFAELRIKQEEDLAQAAELLEKWKRIDI